MEKHLTKFDSLAEYERFKLSQDFVTPNVSIVGLHYDVYYQPYVIPMEDRYFTFIPKESCTFTYTSVNDNTIEYSTDNKTWTAFTSGTATSEFAAGQKVMLRGECSSVGGGIGTFAASAPFDAEGNILSLVEGDNFETTPSSLDTDVFGLLFEGNTMARDFSNVILPNIVSDRCYYGMFKNCTGLTNSPYLTKPTNAVAQQNKLYYLEMFMNCTSLVGVGGLSDLVHASAYMFSGCTSLGTNEDLILNNLDAASNNAFYGTAYKSVTAKGNADQISGWSGSSIYDTFYGMNQCETYDFSGLKFAYLAQTFGNNTKTVILPSTLSTVYWNTFDVSGLVTVVFNSTTPVHTESSTQYLNFTNATIYVPDSAVDTWKTDTLWSTWASKIEPISKNETAYVAIYGEVIDGYGCIDFGLSSGTKWAFLNVGASSITDSGNFYKWGAGASKHTDSGNTSDSTVGDMPLEKDTAHCVMGGSWRIPTETQINELISGTNHQYVQDYLGSGVNGTLFASKTDANKHIFIPAAGYYDDQNHYSDTTTYVWALNSSNEFTARDMVASSNGSIFVGLDKKTNACSIRGVINTSQS